MVTSLWALISWLVNLVILELLWCHYIQIVGPKGVRVVGKCQWRWDQLDLSVVPATHWHERYDPLVERQMTYVIHILFMSLFCSFLVKGYDNTGDKTSPYWQHSNYIGPKIVSQNGNLSNMVHQYESCPYCSQYGFFPKWFVNIVHICQYSVML